MSERARELLVAAVVVAALAAGVLIDVSARDVTIPRPDRPISVGFVERAVFCPAPMTGDANARVSVAPASARPAEVDAGGEEGSVPLDPDRALSIGLDRTEPFELVSSGGPVVAGVTASYGGQGGGETAAGCAQVPSDEWFFPEGSSLLGFDERLLVYNPFPDEAVVDVSFLTPSGESEPANLSDVGVPAGEWVEIAVKRFVGPKQGLLGARVRTVRGRVIAWRVMTIDDPDRVAGVHSTLGAPEPADTWYFPEGAVRDGAQESIALLNPSDEEAVVTISLLSADRVIQPDALAEIAVPSRSATRVNLRNEVRGPIPAGVSAIVQSTNGVEMIAERTVNYDEEAIEGIASEVGASSTERRWAAPPAATGAGADVVHVINASAESVRLSITLLRVDEPPLRPPALTGIVVPGGLRKGIDLAPFSRGEPAVAIVEADGEVVVERLSVGAEVAALMAFPL
ncbi:MAG: DUF5719 family protein [Actinomycetota bacterium]